MNIPVELFAKEKGIGLYEEYTVAKAAKVIGVGVNYLRQCINNNELSVIRVGKKQVKILGVDLVKWKLSKRTQNIKSEITGLQRTETACGADLGMIHKLDSARQQASALKVFSGQKSC